MCPGMCARGREMCVCMCVLCSWKELPKYRGVVIVYVDGENSVLRQSRSLWR